jgi:hypothetical protein
MQVCFGVGVSGSIFCIIRSAPYFGYSRQGKLSIFAGQGRDQYLIEGVVISLLTVGCGLSAYLMLLSTKLKFPLLRHVLVILFASVFVVFGIEIFKAYVSKTAWYNLKDTVPSEVWSYMTSSVKKNSDFFKRFIRLSEVWLFETKDFEGFQKKFNQLIVEYVKRSFNVAQTK